MLICSDSAASKAHSLDILTKPDHETDIHESSIVYHYIIYTSDNNQGGV